MGPDLKKKDGLFFYWNAKLKTKMNFTKELKKPPREWKLNLKK
jgi:hypothetical protein